MLVIPVKCQVFIVPALRMYRQINYYYYEIIFSDHSNSRIVGHGSAEQRNQSRRQQTRADKVDLRFILLARVMDKRPYIVLKLF